jgi:hypothetical protein
MSDRDFSPPVLASVPPSPPAAPRSSSPSHVWQNGDQTSLKDLVAIANPLQHIPVVGSVYRAVTGDDIGFMPRVIGGAIFGGPIGFAVSLVSSIIKGETGKDPGEMVMAGLIGEPKNGTPNEPLVAAKPTARPAALPAPIVAHGGSPDEPLIAAVPMGMATSQPVAQQAARPAAPKPAAKTDGLAITIPAPPVQAAAAASNAKVAPAAALASAASAPGVPGGIPLSFRATPAVATSGRAQFRAETATFQPPPASATAQTAQAPTAPPRFRTAELPQPAVDGGLKTHAGNDIVPTAAGAMSRDDVPMAMTRALDKYAAMMRARNADATPTQVSVLR